VKPIGFATGYDGSMSAREMGAYMQECDKRGFTVGFFSETIELMRDGPTSLAAFAMSTKDLVLAGTMIVRLRSPVVMAQTIASLDELSGGRIIVATGACTRSHAERHSLEHVDPPAALRQWIESIRLLLTGDAVDYDGSIVRLNGVKLGWTPPRAHVPLFIPAISRTGLRLAGEIADGAVLTSVSSPEYSANAVQILRESVAASGRSWDDFQVAQLVNCSIEDDKKAAHDAIRWEVATNFNPVQVPFIARPKMRIGEPYIRDEDLPRFADVYREGGEEALTSAIPDSYVEGMTASGTPDDVVKKVERYREAGVKLPMVRAAAKHQIPTLIDLFAPR
jgi:5,10-methylenetetrahydromethanopterin reductase